MLSFLKMNIFTDITKFTDILIYIYKYVNINENKAWRLKYILAYFSYYYMCVYVRLKS